MTLLTAGILGGIFGIVVGVVIVLGVRWVIVRFVMADDDYDEEQDIVRCPKCEAAWKVPWSYPPPHRNRVRWDGVKLIETCWRCGYSQVKASADAGEVQAR